MSETFFKLLPEREQFASEFVASIGFRWSHLASMTRWLCRRLTTTKS